MPLPEDDRANGRRPLTTGRPAKVDVTWHYLLASETDIGQAKGSWEALKGLGKV